MPTLEWIGKDNALCQIFHGNGHILPETTLKGL